ncbi:LysR family transcriptional regulator [uncultured Paraglaciecola sp.]|uniref:LysR family transcriptional regulator n=1 Tax=uncultured Paraglaciecola sp. TaxID=1765024 RepID=UPI00260D0726|nr:LysR family transcriptional regulator [uncultured Paraglaciecola sp.]
MDRRAIKFDWNRARAFLVTAEEGSLSAAARALDMTQPTVGRQVSALEAELGVSLFERTNSGLVLTQSGADLMAQVKTMAEAATQLSRLASGHADTVAGSVCISATEMISAFVLPPIIEKLRNQWPKIEIEIIATRDTSDLARREADIAIRNYRPTQQELIAKRVKNTCGHLYASHHYIQSLEARQSPQDLNNAIFFREDRSNAIISYLNKFGFQLSEGNFPVIVANHLVQWQMVKQGIGIGFMTTDIGDAEPLVARVLPDFPAFEKETWLVAHRELKTSRRLRVVFECLAAQMNK